MDFKTDAVVGCGAFVLKAAYAQYRCSFFYSVKTARRLVVHGQVQVNNTHGQGKDFAPSGHLGSPSQGDRGFNAATLQHHRRVAFLEAVGALTYTTFYR